MTRWNKKWIRPCYKDCGSQNQDWTSRS